jgi:prepilin-type N-terminal cleavage/methylation domain-containing protein
MSGRLSILKRHSNLGFTLVELAIVLIIVSLLSGGLMLSLSSQMDQHARAETEQKLQEIREALIGYAASHIATINGKPYLPCPDTDGDGFENRIVATSTCNSPEGTLPWNDLGVASLDAWGNRFRYRVEPAFSRNDIGFVLTSTATLHICDQSACISTLTTNAPAVVISHGKNGFGATNANNTANPAPTSADELENTNATNGNFVSHPPTPPGANEFDDLVIWLSPNILYNRLITAGRLP